VPSEWVFRRPGNALEQDVGLVVVDGADRLTERIPPHDAPLLLLG
jgi:hypothetical protein